MMKTKTDATADKVAVVVIHGMGEQRPMETLHGFVEAVWERDASLFEGLAQPTGHAHSDTWSKPDHITGSSELRRVTTARGRDPKAPGQRGIRADFFELHWADITADSTWSDFALWFQRLLRRNPFKCEVPRRVLLVWLLLWVGAVAVFLSGLSTAITTLPWLKGTVVSDFLGWGGWGWVTAMLLLFGAGVKAFLTAYFGDVARYVSASPRNIQVRQAARERGAKLLRDLHLSGDYKRIIVVGHSLGSILAHDLLSLAWTEAAGKLKFQEGDPVLAAIQACEQAGIALLETRGERAIPSAAHGRHDRGCACSPTFSAPTEELFDRLERYRLAQRRLFDLLSQVKVGEPGEERPAWLISDIVTLGSPLTHSSFLVARNACELQVMTRSREILRAPPVYEARKGTTEPVFTFSPSKTPAITRMHHAAALAPVRWSNLYDLSRPGLFLRGDMISGPLAGDYGPGVLDLCVQPRRKGVLGAVFPRLFTHTLYWTYPRDAAAVPAHIQALRDAVNVLDDPAVEGRLLRSAKSGFFSPGAGHAAAGSVADSRTA